MYRYLKVIFLGLNKTVDISSLLATLPDKPGVYQFLNNAQQLIYVGKARNLKKRVSSYFLKERYENGKTAVLVSKVADIKYIIVENELDALLLENSLIKKYQPRYNVMLKDDKTYPWICVKKEAFPRVFSTRKHVKDGSLYFGPYASVKMINTLLDIITQLFKLRNCNLNLDEVNINKKKFKVCLEYHIGNCLGPCEGLQTPEDYENTIIEIKEILKGNINSVINHLKAAMHRYSKNYEFENAQIIKEKITLLEKFQSKSVIVSPVIHDVEVYSIATNAEYGFVNYFKVAKGSIIQSHTLELKKKLEESPQELLRIAIAELRSRFNSFSKEIIIPFEIDIKLPNVSFTIPKIGDKKHLLALSEKNVNYYMREKILQEEKNNKMDRTQNLLEQMKKDLHLKELPIHIECFDNSNIHGNYAVSAMSVFKNLKPSKKDYRHFNIKTVEGIDDFASMEEVIYRRYKRLLAENQNLPQLIIIDGGKGQLSSALKSLEKVGLKGKINVISIAKRLEEIYSPDDPLPLYLDKRSETLKIIQQLRDEAHRFGITHHRRVRSKNTIKTELSEIKGVGDSTASVLLQHFKSVKRIKMASYEELVRLVGKGKAKIILNYYNSRKLA